MLLLGSFPPDNRVEKELDALIQSGFQVSLLCFKAEAKPEIENYKGMKIYRRIPVLPKWRYYLNLMTLYLFYYDHSFYREIIKLSKEESFEGIHVHDLPLTKTAIAVKKQLGCKVVLDMHENFPAGLRVWAKGSWRRGFKAWIYDKIFTRYSKWSNYEKKMCELVDAIIVVVDEMKDRLINDLFINESKITIVSNTEKKDICNQDIKNIPVNKEEFKIIYAGGVGPERGVDTIISALNRLKDSSYKFSIVGSGDANYLSFLKNLSVQENVADQVEWVGFKSYDIFLSYIASSQVSVIPHHFNAHTDNTIPHKLFQSMGLGTPLLVSSCRPLKRVVESSNSGLVFEAGNIEDCAEKIELLRSNSKMTQQFGLNGVAAIKDGLFCWEKDAEVLSCFYKDLFERSKS